MRHTGTCWYDGHRLEIEYVRREQYRALFNGEEFDTSPYASSMQDDMITEAKYRAEREPDFALVCHEVRRFCDEHVPGRNDENDWALFDSLESEVVLNDHALLIDAMLSLEEAELLDVTKAYDAPNYQFLLRPTENELPDPEDLRERLPNTWNRYE